MGNYKAPGVYVQDLVSGSQSISQASSSVGVLIGVTRSGIVGVAQKIGSCTEFIYKYANGLDTPFLENSYLPYAVHGFFTNGGKELYIGSVKKGAIKATLTSEKNSITATALSEGVWGNDIKVSIKKNAGYTDDNKAFDVTIAVGTSDSVVISDVTVSDIATQVMTNGKAKHWLSVVYF
jgi:phage tail sheath protein FI